MVQLIEDTQASITNKGVFYEPGKEPGPDDLPKLHLLIESNDEFRVKHAVSEIKRLLIEGSAAAMEVSVPTRDRDTREADLIASRLKTALPDLPAVALPMGGTMSSLKASKPYLECISLPNVSCCPGPPGWVVLQVVSDNLSSSSHLRQRQQLTM